MFDKRGGMDRRVLAFIIIVALIIAIIGSLFFQAAGLTGNALVDIVTDRVDYVEGESIDGTLEIRMNEGELVPADSKVVLTVGDVSQEYSLSSLVSSELGLAKSKGDFYVKNAELKGSGEGYGLPGFVEDYYPEVEFELIFFWDFDEKSYDDLIVPEVVIRDGKKAVGDAPVIDAKSGGGRPVTDVGGGETGDAGGETGDSGDSNPSPPPSPGAGLVSSELSYVVTGRAKGGDNGKDFVYVFQEGRDVGLVSGSISVDGQKIADTHLILNIQGTSVIVESNYKEERTGFGPEFVGSRPFILSLDLARFGLVAEGVGNQQIGISLVYQNEVIGRANKAISVTESEAEEELEEPEVLPEDVYVDRVQHAAVLWEPVSWSETIYSSKNPTKRFLIKLPESAENAEVVEVSRKTRMEREYPSLIIVDSRTSKDNVEIFYNGGADEKVDESAVEEVQNSPISTGIGTIDGNDGPGVVVTGNLAAELTLEKETPVNRFVGAVKRMFSIDSSMDNVIEVQEEGEGVVQKVVVSYQTPPATALESEIDGGKMISVVAPNGIVYENLLAYTEIPRQFDVESSDRILVYSVKDETYIESNALDVDGDGLIDYAEWNIDSLEGTEDFIIEITHALHLDSGRKFISNLYKEAKELDGIWTETVAEEEYVRVTFEEALDSGNDITIYPRIVSGNPSIEIYEKDGEEAIARFGSLAENEYNKVFLSGLAGEQDVFDLQILSGSLEFDHIIDPSGEPPIIEFVPPTPEDGEFVNEEIPVTMLSFSSSPSHYVINDFDNSIALWMTMDDLDSQGNPTDSSTYENHGSKRGESRQVLGGQFANAFAFDGSQDWIVLGRDISISDFGSDSKFSVAAWVKPLGQTTGMIVSDASTRGVGWSMYYDASLPGYKFVVSDGSAKSECAFADESAGWKLFVATYDGERVRCKLNDVSKLGASYTGGDFRNNGGVSIGSLNSELGALSFNGLIDDVFIFSRDLSSIEASAMYDAGRTQYNNVFSDLEIGTEYGFIGHAVDSAGNVVSTEKRRVSYVQSCLELPECREDGECTIENGYCVLNSDMCSAGVCNFNKVDIRESTIVTGFDGDNAKDLSIRVEAEQGVKDAFNFQGSMLIFKGKEAEQGGNGGHVSIRSNRLLTRRGTAFDGTGGFSNDPNYLRDPNNPIQGGNGGTLNLEYFGVVGREGEFVVDVGAGSSYGGYPGQPGYWDSQRDLSCVGGERDVDVDSNGVVDTLDIDAIVNNYNKDFRDSGFQIVWDNNCDGKTNIIDLAGIGRGFGRGV